MKPYIWLVLCAPAYAQPPQYTLIDLGNTTVQGLNNNGDVVGQRGPHGFLYKAADHTFVDIGTLGGSTSYAYAVNDCQVVVGRSFLKGDQSYHPMLYSAGRRTDLQMLPNQKNGAALSLNNNRVVVGFAVVDGETHAIIFGPVNDLGLGVAVSVNMYADVGGQGNEGFLVEEGYAAAAPLMITAINDFSDAVGDIAVSGATHAALYHEGQLTDLGNLANQPGWNSHAKSVNDITEVVGQSDALPPGTNQGVHRAFLYSHGALLDLTALIAPSDPLAPYVTLVEATGINDSGWVAANGTDTRDGAHGYLLKRVSPALQWKRTVGGCP